MGEVLFNIPPISHPAVDKNGRWTDSAYRLLKEMTRRMGGEAVDKIEAATVAAGNAADAASTGTATSTPDGTYGHSAAVARVTVTDGKVTRVRQTAIAYPVETVAGQTGDVLPQQTGWPAPSTLTVSNPPTQAEVQAIELRLRNLIISLRATGLLAD